MVMLLFHSTDYCFFALFAGESLESLSQKLNVYHKQTTKLRHGSCSLSFNMGYQIILNITSLGENDPTKLDGELFCEEGNVPRSLLFFLNLVKGFLFLLFGRPNEVMKQGKDTFTFTCVGRRFLYSAFSLSITQRNSPTGSTK